MEEAETDSEDELPPGWEARVTAEGKVYYANHLNRSTQFAHPVSGKRKKVEGGLPYGWRMVRDAEGNLVYEDTIKQRKTYTDPRLAFAVEDDSSADAFALSNPGSGSSRNQADVSLPARSGSSNFVQRFDSYSTALGVLDGHDLRNLYVIVTGANTGIGYETARALALHGAHVTFACRNLLLAQEAMSKVIGELTLRVERSKNSANNEGNEVSAANQADPHNRLHAIHLDLASLDSVRRFAAEYRERIGRLDILVLNAAVFAPPFTITADGYESTLAVNHLGHFYLTRLLRDLIEIKNSERSANQLKRIIVLSSESHRGASFRCAEDLVDLRALNATRSSYVGLTAYNDSKLCNLLFVRELRRRLSESQQNSADRCHVYVFGVHPGNMVRTDISRNWWAYRLLFWLVRPFTKSIEQAAATTCYTIADRRLERFDGSYLNNCCLCEPSKAALDANLADRLWTLSEHCIEKFERENPW